MPSTSAPAPQPQPPAQPKPEPQPPAGPKPEPQPQPQPAPAGKFQAGQRVYLTTYLNVRRTPGYVNKGEEDIIEEAPLGAEVTIVAGPQRADDLLWWQVRYVNLLLQSITGWVAEANKAGKEYLSTTKPATPTTPVPTLGKTFVTGNVAYNAFNDTINVRRSPGYNGKPAADVVIKAPPGAVLTIAAGPQAADSLTWWQVTGALNSQAVTGWVAEVGTMGERFLVPIQFKDAIKLGKPFKGRFVVTQLFGERPEFYKVFSYDGVPLRVERVEGKGVAAVSLPASPDQVERMREETAA